MKYAQALSHLMQGQRMRRKVWCQPNSAEPEFIVLIPGREITVSYEPMVTHLGEGTKMIVADHIDALFKPKDGGWFCIVGGGLTEEDYTADDWEVVDDPVS